MKKQVLQLGTNEITKAARKNAKDCLTRGVDYQARLFSPFKLSLGLLRHCDNIVHACDNGRTMHHCRLALDAQ